MGAITLPAWKRVFSGNAARGRIVTFAGILSVIYAIYKLTLITNNIQFLFLTDETDTLSGCFKALESTSKEREPITCHQTAHLHNVQLVVQPTSPLVPFPTSVSASLVSCLWTTAPVPGLFLLLAFWTKEAIVGPQKSIFCILDLYLCF